MSSYSSLQDGTAILNPLLTCYWLIHTHFSFSLYDLTTVCYRLNSFSHFSHVGGLVPFLGPLPVSQEDSVQLHVFELPVFISPDVAVACNSHLSQLHSFVVYSPPLNSQLVLIVKIIHPTSQDWLGSNHCELEHPVPLLLVKDDYIQTFAHFLRLTANDVPQPQHRLPSGLCADSPTLQSQHPWPHLCSPQQYITIRFVDDTTVMGLISGWDVHICISGRGGWAISMVNNKIAPKYHQGQWVDHGLKEEINKDPASVHWGRLWTELQTSCFCSFKSRLTWAGL